MQVSSLVGLALLITAAVAEPVSKGVAATVNGVAISQKTLGDVVDALLSQSPDPPDDAARSQMRQQALDSLIAFELLYQESQKHHLSVSDSEVEESIKATEARFESAKEYNAALRAKKLTRKDIERDTRKMLAVNRVLVEVVWRDIRIDEAATQAFYDENREQFRHPAEIRLSDILIRAPHRATPAERREARAKAEKCLQRVRAGEDFAAVAKSASEDETTALHGGDLGFVSRGSMVDAVEEAAFRLQPGQVSEVIGTPYGFHIVKVIESRPEGIAPLEEVRDRIVAVLTQEQRLKEQDAFVANLRKNAVIEMAK